MKKFLFLVFGASLFTSVLFAHGNNNNQNNNGHMMIEDKKKEAQNNHMGDHMHNGKMTNHSNPNGMTDEEMNMMKEKKQNKNKMGH